MADHDARMKGLESLKDEVFSKHPEVKDQYDARQKAKAFVASVRGDLASQRVSKHLKQGDVAQSLGVSQPVISRIERDTSSDLGLETLYRYAEACGMRPVVTFVPSTEGAFDDAGLREALGALHVAVGKAMQTMFDHLPANDVHRGDGVVENLVKSSNKRIV